MRKLRLLLLGLAVAAMAACGSSGDDVDDERGDYSVRVQILGVQDCGYVTHNLDRDLRLYTGTDNWNFTRNLSVILEAYDGGFCVFESWGGDCAFANPSNECPLTVDGQYNVTATFITP